MSKQSLDYSSLSTEAQKQARVHFIAYYIRQYKGDNLEEISSLADDRDLAMINHLLEENGFQTADALVPLCERMVAPSFDRVLAKLDMKYNSNGSPEQAWNDWAKSLHAQLPVED